MDALPEAVISANEDGLIVEFNRAAEEVFGYRPEEVLGEPLTLLMPERLRLVHRNGFERFLRTGESHMVGARTELTGLRRSGVEFPLELSLRAWDVGAGTSFTAVVRDLSERKQEEAHARLATIVESSEDAIVGTDLGGTITSWNRGARELYGYSAEEAQGRRVSILMPPERSDELTRMMERARLGERVERYETVRQRKDGRNVHVSVTISPVRDALGRITGTATIARDVTESKRAEDELRRSNEELEQFAYVASHDLSEPLRVIAGFIDLLARRYRGRLDEEADRFIDFTVSGVERMQTIIDDLLAYSRAGRAPLELVPVDTALLVQEVLQALASSIAERGASIEIGGLPMVWAEPTLLRQLLQNVIGNAVKFAALQDPRVRIAAVREPESWRFDIADNGAGVDPRHAKRIFEMFQRMHGREIPGTGIGLAIAKRAAERHGGSIWVAPAPGGGSVFRFTIPDHSCKTRALSG